MTGTSLGTDQTPARHVLRLFVAGTSQRSLRLVEQVRGICEQRLAGDYELEIVDIYQQPHLAQRDGVIAAPTLLKVNPPPVRRVVGDLSDETRILRALDLHVSEAFSEPSPDPSP